MIYSQLNGRIGSSLPVNDRAVLYGDALFETIAIKAGTPLLLEQHISRLSLGAERLDFTLDFHALAEEIKQALASPCVVDASGNLVMRLTITRGVSGRGYTPSLNAKATRIITLHEWPDLPDKWRLQGMNLLVSEIPLNSQPHLAGIKHANRLEQVLASQTLSADYDDALMLDQNGAVVCSTKANVFALIDGTWLTHNLSDCGIAGITRDIIAKALFNKSIELNKEMQFSYTPFTINDLAQAEEIFICNSLMAVMPVRQITNKLLKSSFSNSGFKKTHAIYKYLKSVQACI